MQLSFPGIWRCDGPNLALTTKTRSLLARQAGAVAVMSWRIRRGRTLNGHSKHRTVLAHQRRLHIVTSGGGRTTVAVAEAAGHMGLD